MTGTVDAAAGAAGSAADSADATAPPRATGPTVEQQRRQARRRHVVARIVVYVVAILAALLSAFPFIVEGIITFKRDQDLYAPGNNPFIYNLDPTVEHLDFLFTGTDWGSPAAAASPSCWDIRSSSGSGRHIFAPHRRVANA